MLSIGLTLIILASALMIFGYNLTGTSTIIFMILSAVCSTAGLVLIIIQFIKGRKKNERN